MNEVRIIPDIEKNYYRKYFNFIKKFNYVFTTGGIGPHDDITAKSISKAFKTKYEYHKEAYKILESYYEKNLTMEEKNGQNAKSAKLIYNPSSAAPGFITRNVLSLPGCLQF